MIDTLKFDENGLIPAIVQDHYTKRVLTLAWMNAESLAISIAEKRTCFYSRSRRELWRKGETSGNVQRIASIHADCDGDAIVVEVVKDGPACHTGSDSCFATPIFVSDEIREFSLSALFDLIAERDKLRPEGSYTTYLFEKGLDKILKKVGEETAEVIIGAKNSKEELVYEISDLIYHLMVLMVDRNVSPRDVCEELASRYKIVTR
jgi:phosphoribosyl-ATP pyrophosphohydrolase/phosphoribosyl-AMP cyclohydrolase